MGKRLFIGVKVIASQHLFNVYNEIKQNMINDKVKWVEPSNMHLTLTFLGNTEEHLIPSLKSILENLSEKHKQFDLALNSFGVFKSLHNPTVVWIGVEKNDTFIEIKKELDNELDKLGIAKETREFNPHLTLGRPNFINDKKVLISLIDKLNNVTIDKQAITNLVLFESLPGSFYKALFSCKLK